jgi:hypothetical protein
MNSLRKWEKPEVTAGVHLAASVSPLRAASLSVPRFDASQTTPRHNPLPSLPQETARFRRALAAADCPVPSGTDLPRKSSRPRGVRNDC